jgi:hypothetical protein
MTMDRQGWPETPSLNGRLRDAEFTPGEDAALCIIADECRVHGICDLANNAIAARDRMEALRRDQNALTFARSAEDWVSIMTTGHAALSDETNELGSAHGVVPSRAKLLKTIC